MSRPLRSAAALAGGEAAAAEALGQTRVRLRLQDELAGSREARETLRLAANMIARFCPQLELELPRRAADLEEECGALLVDLHGPGAGGPIVGAAREARLIVGDAAPGAGWTVVGSEGWLGRVGNTRTSGRVLPRSVEVGNPIGALAAACLGVGEVFLTLFGSGPRPPYREVSLWERSGATRPTLDGGPPLPHPPIDLNAWLIGCGAVANGFAYAVSRLPISGSIEAVDREALGEENFGSYVLARNKWLGAPKVAIVEATLDPAIAVTARPEEFQFFQRRLGYGQVIVPPIVVNGLDNVETRHLVQRLWPPLLIDMAAGGTTSQVIVNKRGDGGICLLGALQPDAGSSQIERAATATGLRPERLADDPESAVTAEDVAAARPDQRVRLEQARRRGQLLCGVVTEANLGSVGASDSFAAAVPFVTAYSGVVAAAETMRRLMIGGSSVHIQFDFLGGRGRALTLQCPEACECRRRRAVAM